MPVNTASAAVHIAPGELHPCDTYTKLTPSVVVDTFVKHKKRKRVRQKTGKEAPQDDVIFDQVFHIVKAFIELGTKNTIEELQAFTNTHIPSPYWTAVVPVTIPLYSCNEAADVLIDWFGPDELKHVVGGERWWQVRGLDGVEGEWLAEREHLDQEEGEATGRSLERENEDILRMENLESVMLYVHGGGYFWGSINTHRFQMLRFARKFRGRVFAVNYRKAPQYPWPCPVQDVLAAYLYLIRPPPNALHKAVDPGNIVFAGDSAGGGLSLTVLTVLRDMGLPMPSGAVLISPWVDLTHSFPSVMHNTETDIIPPHGSLAKPSTLWPVQMPSPDNPRIVESETNPPPLPGHADALHPTPGKQKIVEEGRDVPADGFPVESQEEMLDKYPDKSNPSAREIDEAWDHPNPKEAGTTQSPPTRQTLDGKESPQDPKEPGFVGDVPKSPPANKASEDGDTEYWEPKPPKVLMDSKDKVPLELRSQIQQYAMTEQLTHPLVSPVLQGSLGNLPPLYILAGDGEVLRDEIVYLAHRAANPAKYPLRKGLLNEGRRQKENAEKFTKPTKVHLQVFDGMCHVLTVFMFSLSARYAYRSIAEFVKHVTQNDRELVERLPFPEFRWSPGQDEEDGLQRKDSDKTSSQQDRERDEKDAGKMFEQNEMTTVNSALSDTEQDEPDNKGIEARLDGGNADLERITMTRERVDIHARVRPMERQEDIPCLKIKPGEIGIIKEAPALRWYHGQVKWDEKYKVAASRVVKRRKKLQARADAIVKNALDQGLIHSSFPDNATNETEEKATGPAATRKSSVGQIQAERRWGPLDLDDERPPPSAIAGRRDTTEALALLRKSIYHTAPKTHGTVPRLKTWEAIRAAFDPHDDPNAPPKQSASEQQVKPAPAAPMHGLRIWDKIVTYLGRKSRAKATNGLKTTAAVIRDASD
ncbi:lipase/esterase [Coprinopsis sp. MPI-PUGE-AT-0042]|nr:lipase/esterase [Coprinopsis sp. MPI-PUGE-AT-0042]